MNQSSTKTKKKLQEQYLNLVFFIDTGKTRSFIFRMDRLILSLTGIGLILIWGIFSFWILLSLKNENSKLSTKLKASMNTIIDYQTRYDGIYEKAYSNSSNSVTVSALEAKKDTNSEPAKVNKPEVESIEKSSVNVLTDSPNSKTENSNMVRVEEFSYKKNSPLELVTSFALKNTEGSNRATGRFWGVAIFQTKSGEIIKLTSPEGLKLDDQDQILKPSKGTSFSIKFYRARELAFKAPQGVEGSFSKVSIFISDDKDRIASYPFPIND